MSLKAYMVTDRRRDIQEHGADIVFASNPAQAKYRSEFNNCDEDWCELRAQRVPGLDSYARRFIPPRAMIDNGFALEYEECSRCGQITPVSQYLIEGGNVHVTFDEEGWFTEIVCDECAHKKAVM